MNLTRVYSERLNVERCKSPCNVRQVGLFEWMNWGKYQFVHHELNIQATVKISIEFVLLKTFKFKKFEFNFCRVKLKNAEQVDVLKD